MLSSLYVAFAIAGFPKMVANPDDFTPQTGALPRTVKWLDARKLTNFQENCLLASAEGLINSRPGNHNKVYIVWNDTDQMWLKWSISHGYVQDQGEIGTAQDLVRLSGTTKATLWNEKPFELGDIASAVAGCTRTLLVGESDLLKKYHLTVSVNLADKFSTNLDAYKWLIKNYGKDLNQKAVSITVPYQTQAHNPYNLRDIIVADKIFAFWIAGSKEGSLPGANSQAEQSYLSSVLTNDFPPNILCLGYPWSGDGYGPGEGPGVTLLSQAAKWLVATDNFDNLSFWTSFSPSNVKLPKSKPAPQYDPKQKYGVIVMSDGDNACTFQQFFPDYWSRYKNSAPIGWTMAPILADLAPPIYNYCASHIPQGSTVGSGVSGVGYMSLSEWAKNYGQERKKLINDYLDQTNVACSAIGEKWLWIMRYGQPGGWELRDYADQVPSINAIMGGYGQVSDNPSDAVQIIGHTAIFNCLFGSSNLEDLEKNLSALMARPNAPQFYNIFTMNWTFNPPLLKKVIAFVESKGIKLVTPEQMAHLAIVAQSTKK